MTRYEAALFRKFANHKSDCRCFICRSLTAEERNYLRLIQKELGIDG